jgi:hypothetical protein
MASPQPPPLSTSACAPVNGKSAPPFAPQRVGLTKQDSLRLQWEAHSWRAPHAGLGPRDAALQAHVAMRAAQGRDLHQRLSGTKSETAAGAAAAGPAQPARPRKRGPHPGRPGHGRRERAALPVVGAGQDLRDAAQHGPPWGAACAPLPGAAPGASIAGPGQAPMRRLQRPRSPTTCGWPQGAGLGTAAPAPRVLPQSPWGVAGWTRVWLDQDLYGRPTHR